MTIEDRLKKVESDLHLIIATWLRTIDTTVSVSSLMVGAILILTVANFILIIFVARKVS